MYFLVSKTRVPAMMMGLAGFTLAPAIFAQQPANPVQQGVELREGEVPVYRVSVVEYAERTTKAVNYRHRGGATKVNFAGTPLLTKANGEAKVESKQGYIEIEVEFDELTPANQFGPEYLTYVMWAVTPEGRATNLGEVLLNGNRSKLNVTTELQSFGMLVTAEPYFGVTQPSDVVVLENVIRADTKGKTDVVDAKFELLKRGTYTKNVGAGAFTPTKPDPKIPLEVMEADNAVKLARVAGAEKYAKDTFEKAVANQQQAWKYLADGNRNRKPAITVAREAVQIAEDSRLIALQRQDEERLAEERRAAEARTNQAKMAAAEAAERARVEAENRRMAELNAERASAERARADLAAQQAAMKAEAEMAARRTAEENARRFETEKAASEAARIAADKARADADAARLAAENARAEAAREREAADKARLAAEAAQQAALKDAADAKELAAKADRERQELRDRLQQQLNSVLETKQTARGLIATMSDVLFDVDKATLKPGAREKLAKVAGILMAHPDLTLQLEGHTDSTGSDAYNQRLSENRASSARDFLVGQGIQSNTISATGFGESRPVASNDNSAGRQANRRVELVISGAAIGAQNNPAASQVNAAR